MKKKLCYRLWFIGNYVGKRQKYHKIMAQVGNVQSWECTKESVQNKHVQDDYVQNENVQNEKFSYSSFLPHVPSFLESNWVYLLFS